MAVCSHCDGTGIAPDRIKLECVGCQRPVTVVYRDSADLRAKCEDVRCADCRAMLSRPDDSSVRRPDADHPAGDVLDAAREDRRS